MENDKPAPDWNKVYTQRPSPLEFWYRQSSDPLTAVMFHNDLLTPGLGATATIRRRSCRA